MNLLKKSVNPQDQKLENSTPGPLANRLFNYSNANLSHNSFSLCSLKRSNIPTLFKNKFSIFANDKSKEETTPDDAHK